MDDNALIAALKSLIRMLEKRDAHDMFPEDESKEPASMDTSGEEMAEGGAPTVKKMTVMMLKVKKAKKK